MLCLCSLFSENLLKVTDIYPALELVSVLLEGLSLCSFKVMVLPRQYNRLLDCELTRRGYSMRTLQVVDIDSSEESADKRSIRIDHT